jgi:hypothetical protein
MTRRQQTILRACIIFGIPLLLVGGLMFIVLKAGGDRHSGTPLDLSKNGVHGVYNLRGPQDRVMLFNFRAVEPGVLYRGSGFIRRGVIVRDGKEIIGTRPTPGHVFRFLREKNIRLVISLEEEQYLEAERGYFDYWGRETGYHIQVISFPVPDKLTTDKTTVYAYATNHRRSGLRAGAELIEIMKEWDREKGAVYIHDSSGKDRVGVAVAAYELWRNQGVMDKDELWKQVLDRYMVSNTLIDRIPEARFLAGETVDCRAACRDTGCGIYPCEPSYVCPCWLERIRTHLEFVAQVAMD